MRRLIQFLRELWTRRRRQREWVAFRDSRKPENVERREIAPGVFAGGDEIVIIPAQYERED